jgi:hypothetical protein
MEDERVRSQAEAVKLEREALESARREAEARTRQEQEAHALEESARRRDAERMDREEAARAHAIHEAARLEVEARARAEERERDRRHELEKLEMARVSAEKERAGVRGMLVAGLLGAVFAGAVAAGLYLGIVQPGERARAAQATSELASRDAVITDARSAASTAQGQVQSLTGDLATAKAEVTRLQKQIDDLNRHPGRPNVGVGTVRRTVVSEASTVGLTNCPPGSPDPLCVQH